MSPRAAARLVALGFTRVYDYVAGKDDWGSAGLPLEGDEGSETRAGAHARRDVPRCRLGDALQDVRASTVADGWETCFVVDDDDVILGRLGRTALRSDDAVPVEASMTEGPSTVRPNARLGDLLERMERQNLTSLPVATGSGKLVGLLLRSDAEAALGR